MNIFNTFNKIVDFNTRQSAGDFIGLGEDEIIDANSIILPALIDLLANKVNSTETASEFIKFIEDNGITSDIILNLSTYFNSPERTDILLSLGSKPLTHLHSGTHGNLVGNIAIQTGLSETKTSSLVKMDMAILLSFIMAAAKNQPLESATSYAQSWLNYISDQHDTLVNHNEESKLSSHSVQKKENQDLSLEERRKKKQVKAEPKYPNGVQRLGPWLILLIGAIIIMWFLRTCDGKLQRASESSVILSDSLASEFVQSNEYVIKGYTKSAKSKIKRHPQIAITLSNGNQAHIQDQSMGLCLHRYLNSNKLRPRKRFIFDPLPFKPGQNIILEDSKADLDEIVIVLSQCPSCKLHIEGHTDNVGNAADNFKLSGQRANAVRHYFAASGIEDHLLSTEGKGQTAPIASNKTAYGRNKNRRYELVVMTEQD